jgi:hypothetical protein
MSELQQQQGLPPIYDAREPSEKSKRVNTTLDELETKQLETLDASGKSIIERIATFLGILFGISILSNNFPPPYLKGNTTAKVMIIGTLLCFLLAIGAAIWATQVRYYNRYLHNVSRTGKELERMIKQKVVWLRAANLLFALGAIGLAGLLMVIIWKV